MWNFVQIVLLVATVGSGYDIKNRHDVLMYLNRFGYVNDEDVSDKMQASDLKPMLKEFQKMCNINQTGMLDAKTMDMMNAPRCGNLDINQTDHHTMFLQEMGANEVDIGRYRRYTVNENGLRWKKRELTYKMGMFSNKMGSHVSRDTVLEEIHQAFKIWSEVTNLDFIYRPNDPKVDIELSFTLRNHYQDQYPFDGPGKTLAHAFPPGDGVLGDVHFEDEEEWTVKTPKGINVLFVATHEIGHALGLTHSMVKGAIMQPFYGGYSPKLQLHPDDIEGVQSMYGKREVRQHKPTTTSTVKPFERPYSTPAPSQPETTRRPNIQSTKKEFPRPNLCEDSSIDAITALPDGNVYAFKGSYVFRIDGKGKGIFKGYPHRIESIFPGLEGNLDAAVTRKNGKTYFFKGPYYWRSHGTKIDLGYPKKISMHFPGLPDNLDSAFEWIGALYFTKGDKIWNFDPKSKPFISEKYPIPLQYWHLGENVPRIDASFSAPNGHIYFFYGDLYWRFNERTFQVENEVSPSYPRSSKVMWFGCTGGAPVDWRSIRQLTQPQKFRSSLPGHYDYADY